MASDKPNQPEDLGPILFYDGQCGLCARVVQWCLRHDHRGSLRFAPLQGSTYASVASPSKPLDGQTVVLLDAQGVKVRGDAVLSTLRHLGWPWRFLAMMGRLAPRSLRDDVYNRIAARRHLWLGPPNACDVPEPEAMTRFLP